MRTIAAAQLLLTTLLLLRSPGVGSAAYGEQSRDADEDEEAAKLSKTFQDLEGDVHAADDARTRPTAAAYTSEGVKREINIRPPARPRTHVNVAKSCQSKPRTRLRALSFFFFSPCLFSTFKGAHRCQLFFTNPNQ